MSTSKRPCSVCRTASCHHPCTLVQRLKSVGIIFGFFVFCFKPSHFVCLHCLASMLTNTLSQKLFKEVGRRSRTLIQTFSNSGVCTSFFTCSNNLLNFLMSFFFFSAVGSFQSVSYFLYLLQQFLLLLHMSSLHHMPPFQTQMKQSSRGSVEVVRVQVHHLVAHFLAFALKTPALSACRVKKKKVGWLQLRLEFMGHLKKYYKWLPVLIGPPPT